PAARPGAPVRTGRSGPADLPVPSPWVPVRSVRGAEHRSRLPEGTASGPVTDLCGGSVPVVGGDRRTLWAGPRGPTRAAPHRGGTDASRPDRDERLGAEPWSPAGRGD